jgi:hypothetical protein
MVAGAARAEELPPAYVFAAAGDERLGQLAGRAEGAARAAIAGAEWPALGPIATVVGYAPEDVELLSHAREKLQAGKQAYLDLRLDDAIAQLQGAVDDFDRAVPALDPAHRAELGEALLYLGASQAFSSLERDARRTFARLHVQMPSQEPDPDTFPPDVVELFERSAPRDRRSPQGRLVVESNVPAMAFVDLMPAGPTPVTVEGLMAGTHVVRVLRPGAAPFVQRVEVGRSGEATVQARLVDRAAAGGLGDEVEAVRSAYEGGDAHEAPATLAPLARSIGAELVGVLRVQAYANDQVTLRLRVYGLNGSEPLFDEEAEASVERGAVERVASLLVGRGLAEADSRRSARPPVVGDAGTPDAGVELVDADPGPPGDGELYEQWWFWAAVGGAVAITAVSIAVASSSGADYPDGAQVVLEF